MEECSGQGKARAKSRSVGTEGEEGVARAGGLRPGFHPVLLLTQEPPRALAGSSFTGTGPGHGRAGGWGWKNILTLHQSSDGSVVSRPCPISHFHLSPDTQQRGTAQ